MPLVKSSLSSALVSTFEQKPSSVADAASQWADAYVSYAAAAMTSTGGAAMTAQAGKGSLVAAFTGAFNTQTAQGAAAAMSAGVMAFWMAIAWQGAGTGVTTSPGNASLTSSLAAVFSDVEESSASDKADAIADAFDSGAKTVIVTDTIPAAPSPIVVVAPIQ
jgi:hypothetical protein